MSIKNFKIIFIGTLNIVLLGSISLVNARHRGGVSAVAEQTDDNQKDRLLQQDQAQIASLQKQLAAQSNGGSDANDEDDDDNSAYADSSGDSGDSSGLGGSGDLSGSGSTDSSSSSSSGMTADQQAQIAAMMGGGGGDQGGGDSQSAAAPGGVSAVLGSVMNSPYAMLIQTLLFAGGPLVEVFHLIYNFISKTIHTGDTKAINGAIAEINKQYETATKNIIEEKSRLQELLDAESTTIPQKAIIKLELEKLDLAHDIARKFGEATTKVKAVIDEKGYLPEAEKAKLFDELKSNQHENYQKLENIVKNIEKARTLAGNKELFEKIDKGRNDYNETIKSFTDTKSTGTNSFSDNLNTVYRKNKKTKAGADELIAKNVNREVFEKANKMHLMETT